MTATDPLTGPAADAHRRAVAAAPDDDTPRLAYAAWLHEQAAPAWRARAEFIRLQVAAARSAPDPDRVLQPLTADKLLFAHFEVWWQELPAWLRGTDQGTTPAPTQGYRRGFVSAFLRNGDWWQKGANDPPRVPIDVLELWYRKGKADVLKLATVPQLSTVKRLTVCFDQANVGAVAAAIGVSQHAGRLKQLTLWGPPDANTAAAVRGARGLRNLDRLALRVTSGAQPAAGRLDELIADEAFPTLADVELNGVGTEAELTAVARSTGLHKVRTLTLAGRDVTGKVIEALASSPAASGLRSLSLKQTRATDAGLLALADSPFLSGLAALDLQGYRTDTGTPVRIGRVVRDRLHGRFPFTKFDT